VEESSHKEKASKKVTETKIRSPVMGVEVKFTQSDITKIIIYENRGMKASEMGEKRLYASSII
jgi:hypothetical protein